MKNRILILSFVLSLFYTPSVVCAQTFERKEEAKKVEARSPNQSITYNFPNPENTCFLNLEGFWGNIRIEGYDGTEVMVEAYKSANNTKLEAQARAGYENNSALFDIVKEENTISIKTLSENENIDFIIKVPENTNLKLKMNKGGDIDISSVNELVEVDNQNGSVTMNNLSGWAVVNTTNGDISANFETVFKDKTMSFITLDGNVYLTLPQDLNADLKIKNNTTQIQNEFADEIGNNAGKKVMQDEIENNVSEVEKENDTDNIMVNEVVTNSESKEEEVNEKSKSAKKSIVSTSTIVNKDDYKALDIAKGNSFLPNNNRNIAMTNMGEQNLVDKQKTSLYTGQSFETKLNEGGSIIFISTRNGAIEIKKKK